MADSKRLRIIVIADDKVLTDTDAEVYDWSINIETPVAETGESAYMHTYRHTGWRHITIDYLTVPGKEEG